MISRNNIVLFSLSIINLFFISTCSNPPDEYEIRRSIDYKEINIKNIDNPKNIMLSDIVEDFKHIRLETIKSNVIRNVDKIRFYIDNIIVMDAMGSEKIMVFDKDGHFIRNIGKKGKGPKEYSSLLDFEIDRRTGNIYLMDDRKKRIMKFSIENEFIESFAFKSWYMSFYPLGNDEIVYYVGNRYNGEDSVDRYNVHVSDDNGDVEKKFLPIRDQLKGISTLQFNTFSTFEDKILMNPFFDNHIYEISEAGLKVLYQINFREMDFKYDRLPVRGFIDLYESNMVYSINDFLETEEYLFFQFIQNKMPRTVIIPKPLNNEIDVEPSGFIDDIGLAMPFLPIYSLEDNQMVLVLDSYDFLDLVKQIRSSDQTLIKSNAKCFGFADEVKESDNPVLAIVKLKERAE